MAYQQTSNSEEAGHIDYEMRVIQESMAKELSGHLYCIVCKSRMDTEIMWEKHIKGNRHFRNYKNLECSNEEPTVQKELDRETRPIVGLNYIWEILGINENPVYQCMLCCAGLRSSDLLMEHLMGLRHQMTFLKEHVKEKFSLVNSSALSKSDLESVVPNIISKYEQEYGRGEMLVKKEKRHADYISYKKFYDDGGKRPFPKSARYFPPPKSSRCSLPNSARMKEWQSESEWKVPVRERSRNERYDPYYSNAKMADSSEHKSTIYRREPTHQALPYYSNAKMPDSSEHKSTIYRREPTHQSLPYYSDAKMPDSSEQKSTIYGREPTHQSLPYYSDAKIPESIKTESTIYGIEPTHLDIQNSSLQRDNYSPVCPSLYEGENHRDLRTFLEQKKNAETNLSDSKSNIDGSACVPFSSEINNDSDMLSSLIDKMSPGVFLKLAFFKLDKMEIKEEMELKLLDRFANKTTALALNVKKEMLAKNLRAEYKETLDPNPPQDYSMMDTSTQNNLQFTQDLDNLIQHYKARKTPVYEDVCFQESYSGHLKSSEPMSHHQLNNASQYRNTP